jgi:flagellar biosynthesis GTPase FlhF
MAYITSDNNNAFVLVGESGCGKTSIIAKLAHDVRLFYFEFFFGDFYIKSSSN